jgi:lysophospholipase L1-like esterase
MRFLSNITFLIAVLGTAATCGGKTPIQPPPPPPEMQLACPAAMVREASTPEGTDVHFDAPTPTGGTPPNSVQCQPGSSSIFPIGETIVRCTAIDAAMVQASCTFAVTVRASQTIAKTKFTAFGDSITEGVVSLAPLIMLGPPDTYPFRLEQSLQQRYPVQSIVVINRGRSGEKTNEGALRLPSVLEQDKPEVLLLQEGINNINAMSTASQVTALRTMIVEAQRRGVDVIIATVMPVSPTWRHYQPGNTMPKIQALNTQILALAAQYGLGFPVDLFALFQSRPELIGRDGIHPTVEGQTEIARAFGDEIVMRYGSKSTISPRFSTMILTR